MQNIGVILLFTCENQPNICNGATINYIIGYQFMLRGKFHNKGVFLISHFIGKYYQLECESVPKHSSIFYLMENKINRKECQALQRTQLGVSLDFMKQYGYLKHDKKASAAIFSEEELTEALKNVQKFGAIEETGELDDATLKLMASPRCGNRDINERHRSKRFTTGSNGWNKRNLTFYIKNWSSRLGEEKVARLIGKALKTWGDYGRLEFSRESTPNADIIVVFAKGPHNDAFPFDGPGNVLAHAYFPNDGSELSGDIHFDDDEEWIESKPGKELESGTDFYTVALHELGHSLGVGHSTDQNAVMFPYYRGNDDTYLQLGQDDIEAMYQLYVARQITERPRIITTQTEITRRLSNTTPLPQYPRTSTLLPNHPQTTETIRNKEPESPGRRIPWYQSDGHSSDKTSWNSGPIGRCSLEKEYPVTDETPVLKYNNRWPYPTAPTTKKQDGTLGIKAEVQPTIMPNDQIPDICLGNFDAVSNLRGELYVFKNKYVWRLHDKKHMVQGYPILLSHMFRSLPENIDRIDAAYERPDGKMVLFVGDKYWVYDGMHFVENSPKNISDYGLSTGGIDAVLLWGGDGRTYLYKGNMFYTYNDKKPDNPENIGKWRGVPANLDAAMTWKDGITYFIKGEHYWKFENDKFEVSRDSPRLFTKEWLEC